MKFFPHERIAVFVDGANLSYTVRQMGFQIDFKLLLDLFAKEGRLNRAFYYTALSDNGQYDNVHKLADWLDYNGYTVRSKPLKVMTDYSDGSVVKKGNMDVEIVVDMMKIAPYVDHIVLVSGDGDFRYVIEHCQNMGKRVSVMSTYSNEVRVLSDELRKQADVFIDLKDIRSRIARDAKDRLTVTTVKHVSRTPGDETD